MVSPTGPDETSRNPRARSQLNQAVSTNVVVKCSGAHGTFQPSRGRAKLQPSKEGERESGVDDGYVAHRPYENRHQAITSSDFVARFVPKVVALPLPFDNPRLGIRTSGETPLIGLLRRNVFALVVIFIKETEENQVGSS